MSSKHKKLMKLFVSSTVLPAVLISTGCETPRTDGTSIKNDSIPSFVKEAEDLAKSALPASESPLRVNELVPERALGADELKLPARDEKVEVSTGGFDFPAELMKGTENPLERQDVKLEFDALPLTDVVPAFSQMLGFSYLVDPAVKGTVTFNVNAKMNAREIWAMFEHILWLSGAYVSRNDQFMEILPFEKMPEERRVFVKHNPANVEVVLIRLNNTTSTELLNNIKPFMTKGASITDVKRLNSLLIVESPSNMQKIRSLIEKLDQQWHKDWPQASVKCHSVDTETIINELKSVMPIIGLPVSFENSKTDGVEIKVTHVPRLQVIVVSAPTVDAIKEVERWIKVLDREDIGEQEHIFFYNVRHSTIQDLRAALDSFFATEGSTSTSKKSSTTKKNNTSNKNNTVQSRPTPTVPNRNTNNNNDKSSSDSRSTVFDVPVTIFEDTLQNRLAIRTTPRTYSLIQALLARLDIPPLQVLIQATIVDLTLTSQMKYGLRYAMEQQNGNWSSGAGIGSAGGSDITDAAINFGSNTGSGINLLFKDGKQALNFVASIAGKNNGSVVSAPQLIALSDEEAIIDVSQSKSVPTSTNVNNGDYNTNYEYKNAGVVLTVTPHITANKEVTLELKQDVDEFLDDEEKFVNSEGDITSIRPASILKRSLQTKMVVPDGSTVLMGGLIKSKKNDRIEGIPILMDIPFIGQLFRYTEKSIERTELVVLITVNVIDNTTPLEKMVKRYTKAIESMSGVFEGTEFDDFSIVEDLKKTHKKNMDKLREKRNSQKK